MRPKGSFIDTEWGLAHVPDIQVEDGTTRFRIGFMQYDDPPEDDKPEPAAKRVAYWKRQPSKRARNKGQKRGATLRVR